ncbi:hypothetical protein [Streptomyces brasiliscabiei]
MSVQSAEQRAWYENTHNGGEEPAARPRPAHGSDPTVIIGRAQAL